MSKIKFYYSASEDRNVPIAQITDDHLWKAIGKMVDVEMMVLHMAVKYPEVRDDMIMIAASYRADLVEEYLRRKQIAFPNNMWLNPQKKEKHIMNFGYLAVTPNQIELIKKYWKAGTLMSIPYDHRNPNLQAEMIDLSKRVNRHLTAMHIYKQASAAVNERQRNESKPVRSRKAKAAAESSDFKRAS